MEHLFDDFDRWRLAGQRTQVLRTAALLWSRYGYEPISLRRICVELGLPPGSSVAGFRSKRELLDCLVGEMGTAFEVARRRLVATQRTQGALLSIQQLAASLAEPIEQLNREGEHGRHLLSLWRHYGRSAAGDLPLRVRKASEALIQAAASVLVQQDRTRSHDAMLKACCFALVHAIQLLGITRLGFDDMQPDREEDVVGAIAQQIEFRCSDWGSL